jgi:citrate lyase subunit beta / citryl-CoA lyase
MRSALFVPGDDEKKLTKALASGADALILDLEDSVALANKGRARGLAADFLLTARAKPGRPRLIVRVNPLDGDATDADLDAVMAAGPDCVMLPKSLSGASVQHLAAKLAVREADHGLVDGSTKILAIATERAQALFEMGSYRGCSDRLEGLAWGGEDLAADIGAETHHLPDGRWASPYRLARDLILLAAVAAEVAPIDTVYTNFRDLDGLRAEALAARRDGFTGKMAIHPAQAPIINEVFTPSEEALQRARAIVAAFHAAPGSGVIGMDGEMYDRPHLVRAERLLARAAQTDAPRA